MLCFIVLHDSANDTADEICSLRGGRGATTYLRPSAIDLRDLELAILT